MGSFVGNILRTALSASVAAAVLFSALPAEAAPASQGATISRTMNGIEVRGRFLEVWGRSGSEQTNLYLNGLPITPVRPEISLEDGKTYETQWFERARYELHPDNPQPHDVLLGRLGAWDAEGRGKVDPQTGKAANPTDAPFVGTSKPADADGTQRAWFGETRHTLSGKLLEYWTRYGGVAQFGYPLSEPFEEPSRMDGKAYTVQYFERARMELHPEKPAPYDVELGLLGVEQHGLRAVPGDELPVAPLADIKSSSDTIVIASSQEPGDLSPFNTHQAVALRVRSLIEDRLVARDSNDNLFPLLAWYVPTLENGGARFIGVGADRHLVVKYRLRPGIKWSDGKEVTSNDAMFAYRLFMDPQSQVVDRSEYLKLAGVDNPNKSTIIYSYRSARQVREFWNSVPNKGGYEYLKVYVDGNKPVVSRGYSEIGAIYPEHVLGKIPPEDILDSGAARIPVGTGPWKVQTWNRRQEMVLVPNEHYSLTAKPLIKTIRIKFVTNFNTIWSQVKTGEWKLLTSEAFNAPPADVAGLRSAGLDVVSRPSYTWEHIHFQFEYVPFKERAVREAIITAINRQQIVDKVYGGHGAVTHGVVPADVYFSLEHPNFAKNYPDVAAKYKLPRYHYDSDKAAQLLDAAGWKCPAGNTARNCAGGVREKDGVKLSFVYGTIVRATRQQIQALVSTDLKAIGVDAVVKSYSGCFHCPSPWLNGTTQFGQFALVGGKEIDFNDWLCPDTYRQDGNSQHYCNPRVDAANAMFNIEPPQEAVAAAAEAQALLMGDIVTVPLLQSPKVEVVSNKLANYKLGIGPTSSFWNARQWYFR